MPSPLVRKFMLTLLIGGAVLHVAWSSVMALLLSASYTHRMVDVRRWPEEVEASRAAELVSMYLTDTVSPSPPPTTVFFGSSVAYGYPWPEDVGITGRYAALRPSEHVFNASVIGADLAFMENAILCGATNAGLRADIAIVELQVILSVNSLGRAAIWRFAPPEPCDETIGRIGHWSFVMRHPLGAGWLPFIWDDKASPIPDGGLVPAVYMGDIVSRDDYDRLELESKFHAQIATVLNRAKTIARQVYAFPSPVDLAGVRAARYEAESAYAQQKAALAACRNVPGVHCLDPESFYTRRELYWNLTHFNQHGQQVFAEWLAESITPPNSRGSASR